jgi:NADH:ubiquinone oxidoreductase subunit F (NADH-binding)
MAAIRTSKRAEIKVLLPDRQPIRSLRAYREQTGLQALEKARQLPPERIIETIRRAGLRGRGGAGFPTAKKWEGVRNSQASMKFICANGAEGEPGTFKDRFLLRNNPYQVLEGLAIGLHVIGAARAYICLKTAFEPEQQAVEKALGEMRVEVPEAENIELVLGPDEYLYGEEKAMLEVIEGGLPLPRVFPPYIHGLFSGAYGGPSPKESNPTVVNNIETLAHVPHIINRGSRWFRSIGTEESPGTMVFTVSGDVRRPTVVELPLGKTLRELIFDIAGGPQAGRQIKAVFPGLANALVPEAAYTTPLGFDSMKAADSALGSAGYIVYDDTVCMVAVAHAFARFLYIESCNQCPPCKIGAREITERLDSLLQGAGDREDVEAILTATKTVEEGQRCFLPTSTALVTSSIVAAFPDDFAAHTGDPTCNLQHDVTVPKFVDYVEGEGFRYDLGYVRKQPDWSYTTP